MRTRRLETWATVFVFEAVCVFFAIPFSLIRFYDFMIGNPDGRMGLRKNQGAERLLAFSIVLAILMATMVFGIRPPS
jgi:hypothetical protein